MPCPETRRISETWRTGVSNTERSWDRLFGRDFNDKQPRTAHPSVILQIDSARMLLTKLGMEPTGMRARADPIGRSNHGNYHIATCLGVRKGYPARRGGIHRCFLCPEHSAPGTYEADRSLLRRPVSSPAAVSGICVADGWATRSRAGVGEPRIAADSHLASIRPPTTSCCGLPAPPTRPEADIPMTIEAAGWLWVWARPVRGHQYHWISRWLVVGGCRYHPARRRLH